MSKPFETNLDVKAKRSRDLEDETVSITSTDSDPVVHESDVRRSTYGKSSLGLTRKSLTPLAKPPPIMPPPPPPSNSWSNNSSPVSTPPTAKKRLAPQPPSFAKERITSVDPSMDIEEKPYEFEENGATLHEEESEFDLESLPRSTGSFSMTSERSRRITGVKFRKVSFKDVSKRGFLVPTWFVGILQMTVAVAIAILAFAEILLPQAMDIRGRQRWFTMKAFNVYGFSVLSSMVLMTAGCYLLRAQLKNDLHAVKMSAGYATLSTLLHILVLGLRIGFLWQGKIAPTQIGISMYVVGLSILILTIFGFWFSALGFGVYLLFVWNHVQEMESPEDLHKVPKPVIDYLDRFYGIQ